MDTEQGKESVKRVAVLRNVQTTHLVYFLYFQ